MSVHEVAEQGFGADAATYERVRPGYPPELVAWFAEHLRMRPGTRVLDLAAGTGKLTRELSGLGATVIAAEPVAGMRNVLHRALPDVPLVAATAEALPNTSESLDAITVAQAFHWLDRGAAAREFVRVLRPGGRLGLVWNARDRRVAWADQVWSIMDRVEKRAPWRDHAQIRATVGDGVPGFDMLHEATFFHAQTVTADDVVDRIASVSHVAVLPSEQRERVLDEVRSVLASHPDTAGGEELTLKYRVDAYWCERA